MVEIKTSIIDLNKIQEKLGKLKARLSRCKGNEVETRTAYAEFLDDVGHEAAVELLARGVMYFKASGVSTVRKVSSGAEFFKNYFLYHVEVYDSEDPDAEPIHRFEHTSREKLRCNHLIRDEVVLGADAARVMSIYGHEVNPNEYVVSAVLSPGNG